MSKPNIRKAQSVFDALEKLNWSYGRGDLIRIIPPVDGRISQPHTSKAQRLPRGCKMEYFTYRFDGRSVYALGHQRKIAPLPEEV